MILEAGDLDFGSQEGAKIHLGASWTPLGASWKRLGGVLGPLGSVLGHLGGVLGRLTNKKLDIRIRILEIVQYLI